MPRETRRKRVRRESEDSGNLIKAISLTGFIALAAIDLWSPPDVNIPDWVMVSLVAIAVGASRAVKNFIERNFGNGGGSER